MRDERGAERTELIERIERTGLGRRHDDGGRAERTERTISGRKDDIEDEIINRGREEEEYDRKERRYGRRSWSRLDLGISLCLFVSLVLIFVFVKFLSRSLCSSFS